LGNPAFTFDDGAGGVIFPANLLVGFDTCRVYFVNSFKTPGPSCNRAGNPIDPFTGNKYEREVDFASGNGSLLTFVRHYNSYSGAPFKDVWTHNFYRKIIADAYPHSSVEMYRPEGARWTFVMSGNTGTPDADINATLQRLVDGGGAVTGYTFVGANDERESYDASGTITLFTDRSGRTVSFAYSNASTPISIAPKPGLLISATDDFSRRLQFTYNNSSKLSTVTQPDGQQITYKYDATNRLSAVTYPDNTSRTYIYNEAAYTGNADWPFALTGIVNENNARFATFLYDGFGRAVASEHAGGADKITISNSDSGQSPTIVDSKGTSVSMLSQAVLGVPRAVSASVKYSYCGAESKSAELDAAGNIVSRTDFQDNKTCYSYDPARNLETARLEGILWSESCATVLATPPNRPEVRKIATTWNANYRLPATMVEPAPGGTKTTTFTYDGAGNITQKSIIAPANDSTSNAVTRTWNWTYAALGRVLTATDPDSHTTTTTYYADTDADLGKRGNVQTTTNAAGHITRITSYDANGRPLSITDPNGLVTTLTYHPRGWLTSRQVGSELTSYTYDGVGQLTKVTLPDGSYLQYTYDAAHRLTQINDSLNNRIVYTLDAMGNRIQEQAFDPGNTLSRSRQQVFDSLNRLHQMVGAQ
jgi:YD repeat-containing protein